MRAARRRFLRDAWSASPVIACERDRHGDEEQRRELRLEVVVGRIVALESVDPREVDADRTPDGLLRAASEVLPALVLADRRLGEDCREPVLRHDAHLTRAGDRGLVPRWGL